MKIEQLFEVRSTNDLQDIGVNLNNYSERKRLQSHNGYDVYVRYHKDDSNVWLLDINEQGFVCGTVSDQFKGQTKHKLFITQRGWTVPEARNKGLITNIMFCLFHSQDFALMCDDIVSPSGKAMWLKLCNILRITHCYQIDRPHNNVRPISKEQMLQQFNNSEDDLQYIIEDNFDYNQMIGDIVHASVFKETLTFEKYLFEGYL